MPFDPNDSAALCALRELAEQAARAGGDVARAWFSRDYAVRRKSDGTEVTDADEAAQAAVLACLRAARPDDALIAEEVPATADDSAGLNAPLAPNGAPDSVLGTRYSVLGTPYSVLGTRYLPDRAWRAAAQPSDDRLTWIIDPLDGTRNYVRGIPIYACSVAAMQAGSPLVGAIYTPQLDELLSIARGGELLRNGQPAASLRNAVACRDVSRKPLVGIPSLFEGDAYQIMQHWSGRVVLRNLGSTALHLALVATGQLQATLVSDSRLWDIAAGWLMVTATGGVMTRLNGDSIFPLALATYAGEPIPSLAAADAALHARLLPDIS